MQNKNPRGKIKPAPEGGFTVLIYEGIEIVTAGYEYLRDQAELWMCRALQLQAIDRRLYPADARLRSSITA